MRLEEIKISGMSCGHCVSAVKKALSTIHGITVKDVQIGKAVVNIDDGSEALQKVITSIEAAGYKVIGGN